MLLRRHLSLVLIATLAIAHWGRATMCHCQHTAKSLPHIHLSELTFGLLGKPDHAAESPRRCACHSHRSHDDPNNQHSPVDIESPDDDDVIYLPASLDHDWRAERATTDVVPSIVSLSLAEACSFAPRLAFDGPPPDFQGGRARCPIFLLTHSILI